MLRREPVDLVDVEGVRIPEQLDRVVAVAGDARERRCERLVAVGQDAVAVADHA